MQFMGHFPDYPVMPGVLVLEAMAQTGAVAILVSEEYRGKIALFGGVNKCRFRKEVMPGDVLELFCEISAVRGPVGFGKARATVNGETAAEAELSFVIKA
jgi:3-hydroxyacyl-[acyl-carrier-protein] dehydratase